MARGPGFGHSGQVIELVPDRDAGGTLVLVDGHPQSFVDLDDPGNLGFEYLQQMAAVIETLPPGPLAVTHIGGGGLTLARHLQVSRPGSSQIVLEPDAELTRLIRRELPLPRGHRIRIREVAGEVGLGELRAGSADVVVVDAFAAGRVSAAMSGPAFFAELARVLRPTGLALMNLADEPARRYLGRVAATAVAVLPHLALVATPEVHKGRRFGNTVVVLASRPLDLAEVRRRLARLPFLPGVLAGGQLQRLIDSSRPCSESDTCPSPEPPEPGTWRRR